MKNIILYTKTPCPYCVRAKLMLDNLGVSYTLTDITNNPALLEKVAKESGRFTLPQLCVTDEQGDTWLGGFSDISALHREGKLLKKLA